MKSYLAIFLISFAVAFGGGYLIIKSMQPSQQAEKTEQTDQKRKNRSSGKRRCN